MNAYRKQMWNETVTVYHKVETLVSGKTVTSWTRFVLTDCFFGRSIERGNDGKTITNGSSYVVRMPVSENVVMVSVGDLMVKGEITTEITNSGELAEVRKAHRDACFIVAMVKDNSKLSGLGMAHYYAAEDTSWRLR